MATATNPQGIVVVDGTATGTLKFGLAIDGVAHKTFSMREVTVEDLLDAELETDVTKPLNFSAQLMARQLVKVGEFAGPVTIGMIRRLKPHDWRILRAAQAELDALGEAESASAPGS